MLEDEPTENKSPIGFNKIVKKIWKNVGDGNEILVKKFEEKKAEDSANEEIVAANKKSDTIESGDLVYAKEKWITLDEIKNEKANYKENEETKEVLLAECQKKIPLRFLVIFQYSEHIFSIEVNGRKPLDKLLEKFNRTLSVKGKKAEWYFNGKKLESNATIKQIKAKPLEKLICMMQGYDIKTFKRFKQDDPDGGWYMNHTSADSIAFIPSKTVVIFGFGMYYTSEGPESYTFNYEILIDGSSVAKETVVCTKPHIDARIMQVYFDSGKTKLIEVGADRKLAIVIRYEQYDDASRLYTGSDGGSYDEVEGNEKELFKVEDGPDSGNGTDASSGQIPELLYAIKE